MVLLSLVAVAQVALVTPPPMRAGIAAFPRIARPADAAQRRINAAVAALDARVRTAAAACRQEAGPRRSSWQRRVEATMRGPAFVSYRVTDDSYCGGAYPNNGHSAIVYDLTTGRPVDWTVLLGSRLAGNKALTTSSDGVQVVTLASPRLTALYRQGYRPDHDDPALVEQCRGVIEADAERDVPMLAWLDGRRGALALQYDLPHVAQACSAPVLLPAATLRREGASARLLRALNAAPPTISARRARRGG
jgi:hypothetical protein